jgi:Ca2+-binding RTX toxin-like protein
MAAIASDALDESSVGRLPTTQNILLAASAAAPAAAVIDLGTALVVEPTQPIAYTQPIIAAAAAATTAAVIETATGPVVSINAPAYNITINFTGDTTYLPYFTAAAQLWSLFITADVPNVSGVPGPGFVDDLYIDASVVPIDGVGNILGQAGPQYYRLATKLPITGIMKFDSADVENMAANGTLGSVILHEMGHVIGIGTMWGLTGQRIAVADATKADGNDYRYVGTAALTEYRLLSGNSAATYVQLESTRGGTGTLGAHWDETIFGNELMTGFISNTATSTSRMTLAALRDEGYQVDLGYADPYFLASTPLAFRDDYAGNFNTTATIAVDGTATGKIELFEDNDWFRVNLNAGTTYSFELKGTPTGSGTLTDTFLRLRAADGESLDFNNDRNGSNTNSLITFTAATSGLYYLDASAAANQSGTYTLTAMAGLPDPFTEADDTVTLTTAGQTWHALGGNDFVTGTIGADLIYGDAGNDTLSGGGGGADVLVGGLGDDTFFLNNLSQMAFENANEGTDTVVTSVSYMMGANIENVNLTGVGSNDGVLGNDLANTIFANDGNNGIASGDGNDTIYAFAGNDVLDGGSGADAMYGGTGADVYFVDNVGDQVFDETAEPGVYDTVWTTANFALPAEVEILILDGGTLAIGGSGNAGASGVNPNLMLGNNAANALTTYGGDDIILGLDGNDTINAGGSSLNGYNVIAGGNGADVMTAGSGHDFFAYLNISEAGDTINGFYALGGASQDILDCRYLFATFTNWTGASAVDAVADGHLTFDQVGADTLVYADGNGGTHIAGEQILLATVIGTTAASVQNSTLV